MVVDDAIVVVENVETKMAEGLGSPAGHRPGALRQIAGPVIATTTGAAGGVCAGGAAPGSSASCTRQFAVTLSTAVALSSGGANPDASPLRAAAAPRPAQPAAVWRSV